MLLKAVLLLLVLGLSAPSLVARASTEAWSFTVTCNDHSETFSGYGSEAAAEATARRWLAERCTAARGLVYEVVRESGASSWGWDVSCHGGSPTSAGAGFRSQKSASTYSSDWVRRSCAQPRGSFTTFEGTLEGASPWDPEWEQIDEFVHAINDRPRWGSSINAIVAIGEGWPRGIELESRYANTGEWVVSRHARRIAQIGRQQAEHVWSSHVKHVQKVSTHPAQGVPLAHAYYEAELAYWRAVREEMLAAERYALNGAPASWADPYAWLTLRPRDPEREVANYAAVWETYRARERASTAVARAACDLWRMQGYASAESVCANPDLRPVPPMEGHWP